MRWATNGQKRHCILWSILLTGHVAISHCVKDFPESPFESDAAVLLADLDGANDFFIARSPDTVSNLAIWYKADSITLSDGDPVLTWTDDSGSGNDAVSGTVGMQPVFKENQINDLPAVQLDGIDDEMVSTDVAFDSHTVFFVARFTKPFPGSDFRMNVISKHHNVPNHSTALYFNWRNDGSSFATFRNSVDGATEFFAGRSVNPDQWYIVAGTFNGIISSIFIDGELADASDSNAGVINDTSFPFYIGRNANTLAHRFEGDIAEIIMFREHISDQHRVEIECYLGLKYALPLPHNCTY